MIRKLNNKGMTAIEILITFAIVVVIVVSMYDGIMDLKNKETVASYKLSLTTYKNLLTKDIQDDLIKVGLSAVSMDSMKDDTGEAIGYRIRMTLRDGSIRLLEVKQIFGCNAIDSLEADELCIQRGIDKNQSDDFSISYGPEGNLTEYPLPDLGHEEIDNFGSSGTHTIYSLRINEVDVSTANNVFSVRIVLYHPDMGTEQSIDIVSPINLSSMENKNEDVVGNISATIRENNSEGDILENKNEWTNKTLWFGEFQMDSENAVDRFEYSDGCTGHVTGILNTEGVTFSTSQDTRYCIRGVDSTGKMTEWSTPYYFRIDKTAPTCSSSGGGSWTRNAVTITGTCNDADSGCAQKTVSQTFDREMNEDRSPGTVKDKAGNTAKCPNRAVKIDRTKPVYTNVFSACGDPQGVGHRGYVKIDFKDTLSGLGVRKIHYWDKVHNVYYADVNYGGAPSAGDTLGTGGTWLGFEHQICDVAGNCSQWNDPNVRFNC